MDGFGNYTDTTKVVLKEPLTGDSYKSQKGNSFSEQTGNSVSNQTGNKDAFQHGYSNSLIEGMSFSTSLAGTFSTTVGLAIASHLGAKAAVFVGFEASINASAAVKVTKGGTYTFDTVEKWKTAEQETVATKSELKLANKTVKLVEGEIQTIAAKINRIAMDHEIRVWKIMHIATGAATFCGTSTTCGSTVGPTMLNGSYVTVKAITNVSILSEGGAWINGAIVKIG